ncbi:MAG: hypothetical protein QM679_10680 [Patulibacter sp.]
MIVAMIAVRMMQVPVDEIVGVISVWHSVVAAARAVLVGDLVAAARMFRRADIRVLGVDGNDMLVDVVAMRVVQVSVVQVVDVAVVQHRRMPAPRTMLVIVVLVDGVAAHGVSIAQLDRRANHLGARTVLAYVSAGPGGSPGGPTAAR